MSPRAINPAFPFFERCCKRDVDLRNVRNNQTARNAIDSGPARRLSLSNPNTGANWTQFTFQVTGTGSDTLQFAFRDDPAYLALDNISVTENSGQSVPEPSSFLLLGSGVIGLGGVIRRKLQG